jgi:hypothetical protein
MLRCRPSSAAFRGRNTGAGSSGGIGMSGIGEYWNSCGGTRAGSGFTFYIFMACVKAVEGLSGRLSMVGAESPITAVRMLCAPRVA